MLTFAKIARDYWDAEQSRDVANILRWFSPDAAWNGPGRDSRGHAEIRGFYDESVAAYPELAVRIQTVYGEGLEGAIEWCAALTDNDGRHRQLHGVNMMRCDAGLITQLTTYFDPAEAEVILPARHEAH